MTQTVLGPRGTPRRRWTNLLALTLVSALGLVLIAGAQSALNRTFFELDKDATNNATYKRIAVLNSAVATAADGATTTIDLCQDVSAFYDGATVLVDAERMTLASGANLGGGGCPSDLDFKRSYTATRGVGDSVPGAHAKAEDVSQINTGSIDGPDWDQVYAAVDADSNTKCTNLGAVECAFVHDGRGASIFTSSKDYDEISGLPAHWQWRDQSVPDADELDDGFAIKYIDGSGNQNLYFGADRFATNGSKDAGFWFFHKTIAPVPPVGSADGTFTGTHTEPDPGTNGKFCVQGSGNGNIPGGQNSPVPACTYDADDSAGDVLVLTTFTGGGAVTTVRVFEWVGPPGSTAALLERGTAADCVPGNNTQQLCATVNNTTIETAWAYSGKSEPADDEISSGGFLEGGINLSDLGLEGCFSSFMATTRSAPSLTADPKDFILGSFEACGSDVTTTPANGAGTALTDSSDANDVSSLPDIKIGTGASGILVTDTATVSVSGISSWSGTVSFYLCGPLSYSGTPPPLCETGGVPAGTKNVSNGTPTATSDQLKLTSVGRYCWRGFFDSATQGVPDDTDASSGECFEVIPVTPTLSTTSWDDGGDSGSAQGTVDFGNPVYDKVSLSGTANKPASNGGTAAYPTILAANVASNGAVANGTITATLKGPDTAQNDPECTANAAGTGDNPQTLNVAGDDDYFTSAFTPGSPGDYHWVASYSGDSPNTTSTSHNTDCTVGAEDVTVRQIPSKISTRQRVYPNDSARIESSDSGVNLVAGGEVTFRLYVAGGGNSALVNCQAHGTTLGSGGLAYVETKTLNGGAAFEVVATNNTSYPLTSLTSAAYWWVSYDPKSSAFTGRQSSCAESTSVTFADDAGPGTLFTP